MQFNRNAVSKFTQAAPINIAGLAQALGLRVVETDLGDASGKIEREGSGSYLISVNRRHGENRKRFTVAHEIAHFILHRHLIGDGIVDSAMYRSDRGDAVERQANNYAATLLMPAPLVNDYWRNGIRTPRQLSDVFKVSDSVAEIRIRELGLKSVAA